VNTRGKHLILGIVFAALALAALRDLNRLGPALPWRTMDEFADFYCAGAALDDRASPYTYEPLHACEHRVNRGESFRGLLFRSNSTVAVPAPLPAYDFLPFKALSRLPFSLARTIDAVAILMAVGLCVVILTALGLPWELCAAALVLSVGYVELNTGQIIPFALVALALCGLALARGRHALAGVCAASTLIEPAAGLPVVAAVLLFVPRARWATLAALSVLLALALYVVGWHTLLTYVSRVIPAQADSELHFPFQYSLTYVLAYFHTPDAVARSAGALSSLVFWAAGLIVGVRASAALRRPELLVFLPALCSTIAGSYLHQEELCFALPALLVLAIHARGAAQIISAAALCALSIPWILVWGSKQLFFASIFVCAVIVLRLRIDLRLALGLLCVIAAMIYAFELHPPRLPVPVASPQPLAPDALVQDEWRQYAEARRSNDWLWLAIKLPTWGALVASFAIGALHRVKQLPDSTAF
jgi:hypothetical protein